MPNSFYSVGHPPQDPSMGSWNPCMAVCRHCSGSRPSQGYGNSLDNCMSQSTTVKRPCAATTGPFDMEEASLSWGPGLADYSRWDEAGHRWLRVCFLAQCPQFILACPLTLPGSALELSCRFLSAPSQGPAPTGASMEFAAS